MMKLLSLSLSHPPFVLLSSPLDRREWLFRIPVPPSSCRSRRQRLRPRATSGRHADFRIGEARRDPAFEDPPAEILIRHRASAPRRIATRDIDQPPNVTTFSSATTPREAINSPYRQLEAFRTSPARKGKV